MYIYIYIYDEKKCKSENILRFDLIGYCKLKVFNLITKANVKKNSDVNYCLTNA